MKISAIEYVTLQLYLILPLEQYFSTYEEEAEMKSYYTKIKYGEWTKILLVMRDTTHLMMSP